MLAAMSDDGAGAGLDRVLAICDALPEVAVTAEAQHTSFTVRGRRFAWHLVDHHGDGRVSVECKAAPGVNRAMADADPARCYLPPYTARHGWVGVHLDVDGVDWDGLADLLVDAYLLAAPARLAHQVRDRPPGGTGSDGADFG